MMPSAKMAMRSTGPPANMLKHAEHATRLLVRRPVANAAGLIPGIRDVGADAIDDQGAQREPDCASSDPQPWRRPKSSDLPQVVLPPMP